MLKIGVILGYSNFFSYLCKKNYVMGIFIIFIITTFIIALLLEAFDDKQAEKDNEKAKIERIKNSVKKCYEEVKNTSKHWGDEYSESLLKIANNMDKLSSDEIKDDLKPYDIVYSQPLNKYKRLDGLIILDKNLKPKFLTEEIWIKEHRDIMLEEALDADGVRALAEECKNIKFEADTEKFRKDKISEFLND